jgi:hypothetical protein
MEWERCTDFEKSLVVSPKVKQKATIWSRNSISNCIPREMKTHTTQKVCI